MEFGLPVGQLLPVLQTDDYQWTLQLHRLPELGVALLLLSMAVGLER